MIKRDYYSVRTGKITPNQQVNFEVLKKLFSVTYNKLNADGYFQKYFGIECTDGFIPGELGEEVEAIMFVNLRKDNLFPINNNLPNYSEDDFFDVIEGQRYFRELLNPILREYKDGFEISESGEILILSDNGLSNLFEADIPTNDKDNISNKMNSAILKFRRYKSTLDDRREAIRELVDVLKYLKPEIKEHLIKKDESDLFNIANNFGIRHHNKDQQTEYDKAIWYSWIFYYYWATLHAVLRITNKK